MKMLMSFRLIFYLAIFLNIINYNLLRYIFRYVKGEFIYYVTQKSGGDARLAQNFYGSQIAFI